MSNQDVLEPIHLLDLSRIRVNPIDLFVAPHVCKSFLVFRTQKAVKMNSPISVILLPPIEIDMEFRVQRGFYQTKTLQFCQLDLHNLVFGFSLE